MVQRELVSLSACLLPTQLCLLSFSRVFSFSSQHSPIEESPAMLGVMDGYSHCSLFGLSDPYQHQQANSLPFIGRRSCSLGLRLKALFPSPGKVSFTSVVKWGLSH